MNYLLLPGRYCFGSAIAGSGLMQIVNGDLVRIVPKLPAWLPAPGLWAMAMGVGLLVIGGAIATGYRARPAAIGFAVLIIWSFVFQRVPEILSNPGVGFMWTNPAKILALLGGSIIVIGEKRCITLAACLLGIFLLICGVQHFDYADFVDTLVPKWIPPGQRFWTYFTAVALLLGGVGVVVTRTRRLAGFLTGVMIFLWVMLLHIPRAVELKQAFELAGVFEALALVGVSWLIAGASVREPSAV